MQQPVSVSGNAFVVSAVVPIVEGRLNAILRLLEALALTEEVRSGNWNRIKPLLAGVEAKEPSARLWFACSNGTYYMRVDNLTSANLLSRSNIPALLAGKKSVGTIVSSHPIGRNVVIIAVPVIEKGIVTGMLGAVVSLDSITMAVKDSLSLPDTMQFFTIDPTGSVTLHSDNERIFQNDISGGTARLVSTGASSLTGWHIAVVSADTA